MKHDLHGSVKAKLLASGLGISMRLDLRITLAPDVVRALHFVGEIDAEILKEALWFIAPCDEYPPNEMVSELLDTGAFERHISTCASPGWLVSKLLEKCTESLGYEFEYDWWAETPAESLNSGSGCCELKTSPELLEADDRLAPGAELKTILSAIWQAVRARDVEGVRRLREALKEPLRGWLESNCAAWDARNAAGAADASGGDLVTTETKTPGL